MFRFTELEYENANEDNVMHAKNMPSLLERYKKNLLRPRY